MRSSWEPRVGTFFEAFVREHAVDLVVFAYSHVSHEQVMHLTSRVLTAGADFALLGPRQTMPAPRGPSSR